MHDTADGIRRAISLFEKSMIGAFTSCRMLHIIMLAITVVLLAAYTWGIIRRAAAGGAGAGACTSGAPGVWVTNRHARAAGLRSVCVAPPP